MTRDRFEYHISTNRAAMAELGEDGWELVSAAVVEGVETFYYKRPAPSLREQLTLSQREQALRETEGSA
ncbi:hypothetical protein [Paenibacillus cymbidii]|uniref:hypothetical protein n=1 Tax=Paenibacillus cymbidii TaxID=1639034 RepID=UPI0010809C64|nr:hypothetical protein [Paenibacillus cymbidii]